MTLSNWIELASLALIIVAGTFLRRYCKRKLQSNDGFEGIISERGKPPSRNKLDAEEECERLQEILNRK